MLSNPDHVLLLPKVRLSMASIDWLGAPLRFDVAPDGEDKEIEGYQLYAVEKWLVERKRTVNCLVVYTGDSSHKITVTSLRPSSSMSLQDANADWDKAIHLLKRDARPKNTPHGTLLVTSLAHFRSDYTIVHIPHGNFLKVKDELYTNINLSRMGCSGRSALTLEEPSDATKDRFLSLYYLPDSSNAMSPSSSIPPTSRRDSISKLDTSQSTVPTKDYGVFCLTVLEFVKMIQAALSIFGMFSDIDIDGLLCDQTVGGLGRWVSEVGEKVVFGLEPMERIADPSVISALFSVVIGIRNKLAAILSAREREKNVTKDPFLYPSLLLASLANYVHSQAHSHSRLTRMHSRSDSATSLNLSVPNLGVIASGNHNQFPLSLSLHSASFLRDHASKDKERGAHSRNSSSLNVNTPDFLSLPNSPRSPKVNVIVPTPPGTSASTALPSRVATPSTGSVPIQRARTPSPTDGSPAGSPTATPLLSSQSPVYPFFGLPSEPPLQLDANHILSISATYQDSTSNSLAHAVSADNIIPHSNDISGSAKPFGGIGSSFAAGLSSVVGGTVGAAVTTNRSSRQELTGGGAAGILEPIVDLREFVDIIIGRDWNSHKGKAKMAKTGFKSNTSSPKAKMRSKRESLGLALGVLGGGGSDDERDTTINPTSSGDGEKEKETEKEKRDRDSKNLKANKKRAEFNSAMVMVITGTVAGSIRGLWTGRVYLVAKLRQRIKEQERLGELDGYTSLGKGARQKERQKVRQKQKDSQKSKDSVYFLGAGPKRTGVWSDGDTDDNINAGRWSNKVFARRSVEGIDVPDGGQSTEDEDNDPASLSNAGLWGRSGRVRGKIESWTGLSKSDNKSGNKRRHPSSIDLVSGPTDPGPDSYPQPPLSISRSEGDPISRKTLVLPSIDVTRAYENEDDDLLSSGQASPVSDDPRTPKSFSTLQLNHSRANNASKKQSVNLNSADLEFNRKVLEFNRKRPWDTRLQAPRISSWSGPVSARGSDDGERSAKDDGVSERHADDHEKDGQFRLGHWKSNVLGGKIVDEPGEMTHHIGDDITLERAERQSQRRRSFHDVSSFSNIEVLSMERMRIDVELCGQLLIMHRREEHLQNVIKTLNILSRNLSETNTRLRELYHSHLDDLNNAEEGTHVLTDLDEEDAKSDKMNLALRTIFYESNLFDRAQLWEQATQPRTDVLRLREKVFGETRKLPPGEHGAHGRFNRLQWTIDGNTRLVNSHGRTESEYEEEINAVPEEPSIKMQVLPTDDEEEEEDVVQHRNIKPIWLLRIFTNWGSKAADRKSESPVPDVKAGQAIEGQVDLLAETGGPQLQLEPEIK